MNFQVATKLARIVGIWILSLAGFAVAMGALVAYEPFFSEPVATRTTLANQQLHPLALQVHALSGGAAMLLALVIAGTFRWRMSIEGHRCLGFLYAGAALLSGVTGLWISPGVEGGIWAQSGFALVGLLWLATTAQGVWAVWKGRRLRHKRAMVRSAAWLFAAVSLRLQMAVVEWLNLPPLTAYPVVAWTSWVPNLLWVEWRLRRP
jgi:hypothetical protein